MLVTAVNLNKRRLSSEPRLPLKSVHQLWLKAVTRSSLTKNLRRRVDSSKELTVVVVEEVDAVEEEVLPTLEPMAKSEKTDPAVKKEKVANVEEDVVETVVTVVEEAVVRNVKVMKMLPDVEVAEETDKELETPMLKKVKQISLEKELEKLKERHTREKHVKMLTLMTVNPELEEARETKANKEVAVDNGVMPNKINPKVKKQ